MELVITTLNEFESGLVDAAEMLELAIEEQDQEIVDSVSDDLGKMQSRVETLEFQRMFSGEMDENSCFLDIHAGSV